MLDAGQRAWPPVARTADVDDVLPPSGEPGRLEGRRAVEHRMSPGLPQRPPPESPSARFDPVDAERVPAGPVPDASLDLGADLLSGDSRGSQVGSCDDAVVGVREGTGDLMAAYPLRSSHREHPLAA